MENFRGKLIIISMLVASYRAVKFIKRRLLVQPVHCTSPFIRSIKNSNRFWHEPRLDIIERLYARCPGKVKGS